MPRKSKKGGDLSGLLAVGALLTADQVAKQIVKGKKPRKQRGGMATLDEAANQQVQMDAFTNPSPAKVVDPFVNGGPAAGGMSIQDNSVAPAQKGGRRPRKATQKGGSHELEQQEQQQKGGKKPGRRRQRGGEEQQKQDQEGGAKSKKPAKRRTHKGGAMAMYNAELKELGDQIAALLRADEKQ